MTHIFNYFFARWWLLFFRVFAFLKLEGVQHMPKEGGVLVVSNHPSYFDPPLLVGLGQLQFGRPIALMAWDKLFKVPILSALMRHYRAFPVDVNNPGRGPFEALLRELKRGGVAGIFPEGGRSRDDLMGAWKPGALRAAASADAQIVPVSIIGGRDVWPAGALFPRLFKRIRVVIHPARKVADMLSQAEREAPLKEQLRICEDKLRAEINAPLMEALLAREKRIAENYQRATPHDVYGMGTNRLAQVYRKRARDLKLLQKRPQ